MKRNGLGTSVALALVVATPLWMMGGACSTSTGGSTGTGGNPSSGSGGTASDGSGGTSNSGSGGNQSGGTGGTTGTGGSPATGGMVGSGGNVSTGGVTGSGGNVSTGGVTGTGGLTGTAGTPGAGGAKGGATGSGGSTSNAMGPCDLYAAANIPCVAAFSTVRVLLSTYKGPLYQVRKGGTNNVFKGNQPIGTVGGTTGGTTQEIGFTADGFADSAAQDAFCGTGSTSLDRTMRYPPPTRS
jgi:hypothetical protein